MWLALDQSIIDNVVVQWRQRLRACGQAEGGHFEHLLNKISKQTPEKFLHKSIKDHFM